MAYVPACRFCHHRVADHNTIEGCVSQMCRCMATPGEATPRTQADLDARPLLLNHVLPTFAQGTSRARKVRDESPTAVALRQIQAEAWERGAAAFEEAWKQDHIEPWGHLSANPYKED